MSLITRCPACETLFRVVPDQLRISQGWVRCGQCEEIFDASQHLQTLAEEFVAASPPVVPPASSVASFHEASGGNATFEAGHGGSAASSWLPPPPPPPELLLPDAAPLGGWAADPVNAADLDALDSDGLHPADPTPYAPPNAAHTMLEGASVHDEAAPAPDLGLIFPGDPVDARLDAPTDSAGPVEPTFDLAAHLSHEADALEVVDGPVQASVAEEAAHPAAPASFGDALASAIEETQQVASSATAAIPGFAAELPPRTDADDAPPAVSFMRGAGRVSAWHKTWVRVVLSLACGLLVLGLALQWVVQERDQIAAIQPQARPVLSMLCQPLGCAVRPLRQIEAMVIESSSFTKLRGEAYRLNFTIKNTASTALAVPAMELTLTDLQDQAVMRRVFTPVDLGATSTVLAPGAEWVATLPVSLRANNPPDRITGYRVLAFYP